ncbi:MAG: ISAs1 family transposase [Polyangiaceae bacterium]
MGKIIPRDRHIERSYYWSSHIVGAETFAAMIRGHGGIENQLHWCLDVGFREDESRIRTDHLTENLALFRKVVMNLARSERTHKKGIQAKRKLAVWRDELPPQAPASGIARGSSQ